MSDETPRYTHDCDRCIFLGGFVTHERKWSEERGKYCEPQHFDLYVCGTGIDTTILVRRSSEPSDYGSGMIFGYQWQQIATDRYGEAFRRAQARGLISRQCVRFYEQQYRDRIMTQEQYDELWGERRGAPTSDAATANV